MSGQVHKISPSHLVLAVRQGNLDTVISLCDCDPSCAAKADDSGETALQIAAHQGNVDILNVLLANGGVQTINLGTPQEKLTPLHLACARGHIEACKLLLKTGSKLDVLDARSYTPLHHAAFKGNAAIVKLLIEAKAPCNPTTESKKAETPLALAAFMRHPEVALMLMKEGDASPAFISNATDKSWTEQLLKSAEEEAQRLREERAARKPSVSDTPPSPPSTPTAATSSQSSPDSATRRPSGFKSSNKGAIRPTTAQRGSSHYAPGRSTLSPRPMTPVFVPPAPLDLDDAEVLRYGAARPAEGTSPSSAATAGISSSANERTIWFTIHEEVLDLTAEEDAGEEDSAGTKSGIEKYALYRTLTKRRPTSSAGSASLPALSATNGAGSPRQVAAGGTVGSLRSDSGEHAMLHLYPISYLGLTEGLMLDQDRRFVFYLDPELQRVAIESQEMVPRPSLPFAPLFVGRWETAAGGPTDDNGLDDATGYIKPLKTEWHCMQMEAPQGVAAKRCLRQASAAAAWLHMRSGICAEFASSGKDAARTTLLVPLCGLLGIHEITELADVTKEDLQRCYVETELLSPLQRALQALGIQLPDGSPSATGRLSPNRPGTARSTMSAAGSLNSRPRPASAFPLVSGSTAMKQANSTSLGRRQQEVFDSPVLTAVSDQPRTPSQQLAALLQEHALIKLLPLAAELRIVNDVQRWHHLVQAAMIWQEDGISRFEQARLATLLLAITAHQDAEQQKRLASMIQMVRVSLGSIVLYESACRGGFNATERGDRLLGVVVDDIGPGSQAQFKVRDLLDDEMVWCAPGQLARASHAEAMKHLRADLLPPPTDGPPVMPFTAHAGAPVQLGYHFWDRKVVSSVALDEAMDSTLALQDAIDKKSAKSVVGVLLEPADETGTLWRVRWPDGTICTHSIGADNRFELCHFQLHLAAGAPLARGHVEGLLLGQDVGYMPVVRSPLWSKPSTDDEVPGSLGVAMLEAGQTVLQVVWGCSAGPRDTLPMYSPDAKGLYQLCHGLVPGGVINMYTAKEGVPIEDITKGAKGTLVKPLSFGGDGSSVVWRVVWEGGMTRDCELGNGLTSVGENLTISQTFHVEKALLRVRLLNEVAAKVGHGGGSGIPLPPSTKVDCCTSCSSCLTFGGRAAFWKGPTAHVVGSVSAASQPLLLGSLVKLNKLAVHLQPGADRGPMACYEPISIPALLKARRCGRMLEPLPRDDIGVVVRDHGPGAWRGIMVRKYGSTQSFWYDEAVLLPASSQDVDKQVARRGHGYIMPRHLQGVPVTDANAAPGMLVQRAFREGAAVQNSEKALTIGVLVGRASENVWNVRWPDGTLRAYKTGYRGQFQLCFAQTHMNAGAPLMHSTVMEMAAINRRLAVTDCMFSMSSTSSPGAMRYVNDVETQLGILSGEARLMEACGLVATSTGERMFTGGPLSLYELSHAIVPGAPLTIYTAKKGIRVELHTAGVEEEGAGPAASADHGEATGEEGPVVHQARPKLGMLYAPVRLITTPVKHAAGSESGGLNSLPRELVDAAKVVWEVVWDEGGSGQFVVGTEAAHTCLKVAAPTAEPSADAVLSQRLYPDEHFVRMLEPVLLVDTGNRHRNRHLARLADSLQAALQWHNQLLRELVSVWWSGAPMLATPGGVLLRPEVELLFCQPDSLTPFIRAKHGDFGSWQTVVRDEDGQIVERINPNADADLAYAIQLLMRSLGLPQDPEFGSLHVLPSEDGATLLDAARVTDASGRTLLAPESMVPLLLAVNAAAGRLAQALKARQDGDSGDDDEVVIFDIGCSIEPSMMLGGGAGGFTLRQGSVSGSIDLGDRPASPTAVKRITVNDEMGNTAPESYVLESGRGNSLMVSVVRQDVGEQQSLLDDSGVGGMPVGPGSLLAMGCAEAIRKGLLGIQRSLGTLAGSSPGGYAGGRSLLLVGQAPCLWLEAAELEAITGCLPRDLPLARCRAAVNMNLFGIWREVSRVIPGSGSGSADVSRYMLSLLKVVHIKARAALAVHASDGRATASIGASEDADQKMQRASEAAGDIKTFAAAKARFMLQDVRLALGSLLFAQQAADEADGYAAQASIPPSLISEDEDRVNGQKAAAAAKKAQEQCETHTRSAFPLMAEAVTKVAISVVKDMPQRLKRADAGLQEAGVYRKTSSDALIVSEKDVKEASSAAEDLRSKGETIAMKLKDLGNACTQAQAEVAGQEDLKANTAKAQAVWEKKEEARTVVGQAKLLKRRIELMMSAQSSSGSVSDKLKAYAANPPKEGDAWTKITAIAEDLTLWASDYDMKEGFKLEREISQAISNLKSKLDKAGNNIPKLFEAAAAARGGMSENDLLRQLKTVAELGAQATSTAHESDLEQANTQVVRTVDDLLSGNRAGFSLDGSSFFVPGLQTELDPVIAAADALTAVMNKHLAVQAAFTLELAAAAASKSAAAERVADIVEKAIKVVEEEPFKGPEKLAQLKKQLDALKEGKSQADASVTLMKSLANSSAWDIGTWTDLQKVATNLKTWTNNYQSKQGYSLDWDLSQALTYFSDMVEEADRSIAKVLDKAESDGDQATKEALQSELEALKEAAESLATSVSKAWATLMEAIKKQESENQEVAAAAAANPPVPPLIWSVVKENADREAAAAKKQWDDSITAIKVSEDALVRMQGVIARLKKEIQDLVVEASQLRENAVELRRKAANSTRGAMSEIRRAEGAMWRARREKPASEEADFSNKEDFDGEVVEGIPAMERAQAAVNACNEALQVLGLLRRSIPVAVRSSEAADRMLAGCMAEVSKAGVKAAAEWARTAALPCETVLADIEWYEKTQTMLAAVEKRQAKELEQMVKWQSTINDLASNVDSLLDDLNERFFSQGQEGGEFIADVKDMLSKQALSVIEICAEVAIPAPSPDTSETARALREVLMSEEGQWDDVVAAFSPLEVVDAIQLLRTTPPPRQLKGQTFDLACASAEIHLPAVLELYFSLRSQVDPSEDLSVEDASLQRALQSVFGEMDKFSKVTCELAEQALTAGTAPAGQASSERSSNAGSALMDSSSVRQINTTVYDPVKQAVQSSQMVALANKAVGVLAACATSLSQQVHPETAQKLEAVSKAAKTVANSAKRTHTALLRAVADAVKVLGPPSFGSGVHAIALAKLAIDEGDLEKQREWARQASELLQEKVRPEMEAAMAALVPARVLPAVAEEVDEEPLDAAEEAAKQARIAEQNRLQRLEQVEKERQIMAFISSVAVEVAAAAADTAAKLDLISETAANEDEMKRPFMPMDTILALSFQLAGEDTLPDGRPAKMPGQAPQPDSALVILSKMIKAMRAVQTANSALQLAGSHDRVKKVEELMSDCLSGCTNIPRMAADQLNRVLAVDDDSGEVYVVDGFKARDLRAYEQLVSASIHIAELTLNSATLITVKPSVEDNLSIAKGDLEEARKKLGSLSDEEAATDEEGGEPVFEVSATATLQEDSFPIALQVLLAKQRVTSDSMLTSGATRDAMYNLVVGFAPPSDQPLPIAEHLQHLKQDADSGEASMVPASALAATPAWVDAASDMLQRQLEVVQGQGSPEVQERLEPAQSVLKRPAMQKLLQPFVTLMDACNRALAATSLAAESRPDDALLLSQALLGAADMSQQAASANFSQFKRWEHDVANMQSAARLVLYGLCKAQALAAADLEVIEVGAQARPPPKPRGGY